MCVCCVPCPVIRVHKHTDKQNIDKYWHLEGYLHSATNMSVNMRAFYKLKAISLDLKTNTSRYLFSKSSVLILGLSTWVQFCDVELCGLFLFSECNCTGIVWLWTFVGLQSRRGGSGQIRDTTTTSTTQVLLEHISQQCL